MDIIIVSMDDNNLSYLSDMITHLSKDIQIYCFDDPLFAIKHIANNDVDIVMAETNMKYIDTIQFTKLVRQLKPDIDITILSFNYNHEALSVVAGADRFITEPISNEDLEEILRFPRALPG